MCAIVAPMQKKKPYPPSSAEACALNVVGDKWILLIVKALMNGPMRFVTLQREGVPGISTEMLRVALHRMRDEGLVTRQRFREVPPRVEYTLTGKGYRLEDALYALAEWARWAKLG